MRHKPLVLDGPSQTYKTTAANMLADDQENYLQINCANLVNEPNLRSVRAGTDVINCDELNAKTFIDHKKVFQGANGPTTLGENTPGGAQAYTRRLNRVKMVITSNHFKRDIEKFDAEDQGYIWKNIYYIQLGPGETMFDEPVPPTSTSTSISADDINPDGMWLW